jgi:tRNA pseudouridine55 synthase
MEPLSGLLVLNKQRGVESTQMCNRVKHLFEQGAGVRVKVGHGGTLDPMATGVMVFGVGNGTKLLHGKLGTSKGYHATAKLGEATNTLDSGEGGRPGATNHAVVVETMGWDHLSLQNLVTASAAFKGEIMQKPPLFSAVRQNGVRNYTLAYAGASVDEVKQGLRPATIHALEVSGVGADGPVDLPYFGLRCVVGGGTYIRSLIDDLARAAGSVAHMTALLRWQHGNFNLQHCANVDIMERGGRISEEELYLMLKANLRNEGGDLKTTPTHG